MPLKSLLPLRWDLPEIFRERLGQIAGRQRTMAAEGHLLVVLHRPPSPDESERTGRFFWRNADGDWRSSESGTGSSALAKHVEEHRLLIEKLEDLEERSQAAGELFDVLHHLTPLHRAIRHMRGALQEAREQAPDALEIIDLRDQAESVERSAELLLADARNTLDTTIARQAERQATASHQMAVSAHRLNSLAAFFFPIATLTAVFGTNLAHGLETRHAPWPFLIVLAGGLVLGWGLKSFVTRSAGGERDDKNS